MIHFPTIRHQPNTPRTPTEQQEWLIRQACGYRQRARWLEDRLHYSQPPGGHQRTVDELAGIAFLVEYHLAYAYIWRSLTGDDLAYCETQKRHISILATMAAEALTRPDGVPSMIAMVRDATDRLGQYVDRVQGSCQRAALHG